MNVPLGTTNVAALFFLVAMGCGIAGSFAATLDRELELGVVAWFTAGVLAALLAIFLSVVSERRTP